MSINLTNKQYAFANPVDLGIWQALQEVKDTLDSEGIGATIPTSPINLYVSTTGNDSNNGRTLGTAFRTVKRAVIESEKVVNGYFRTIINVDTGDYSNEEYLCFSISRNISRDGFHPLLIKSISNTATDVILPSIAVFGGTLDLASVTVKDAAGTIFGLVAANSGGVDAKNLITLNTQLPLYAYNHGWLLIENLHVKDSTIPEVSAVCWADRLSSVGIYGTMQNTNSTGPRYRADGLSIVYTNGQGENYLPGTTAGTVSNGGVYA